MQPRPDAAAAPPGADRPAAPPLVPGAAGPGAAALLLLAAASGYAAVALAASLVLTGGEATPAARGLAALGGTVVVTLCLALAARARLAAGAAVAVGLVALGAAVGLFLLGPGGAAAELARGALLLVAAATLGDAFAAALHRRIRDFSVLLTATVCLALFDTWSVLFGPARAAAAGGLLASLLVPVPVPGGWLGFLGVSDLVAISLLARLFARRGLPSARVLVAGGAGIAAALGQALLTARAAPALPWILGLTCLVSLRELGLSRASWRRTGRWALGTAALLALATWLLTLRGAGPA